MTMRILNTIGDVFTPRAREILSEVGETDYIVPTKKELKNIIEKYDAVVAGLGVVFDEEIFLNSKNLKIIATATTGLDHIDTKFAKKEGIEVLSLRGENEFLATITSTAELAWGLILSLSRFLPWAFDSVKKYEWEREKFRGHSLYGKTLGIVGLGRLGQMMARYAEAFNMKVIFCDPNVEAPAGSSYRKLDFGSLLEKSDVLTIHVHLNEDTKHLFNEESFKRMKKRPILINTSRGGIVDENALLEALKREEISGYGADVLEEEIHFSSGSFKGNLLVEYTKQHNNLIVTPHIGGMTVESRVLTDIFIANKLVKAIKNLTTESV